ncbi:MAG TPA: LytTR family DNA-binding domain-containing protein [Saprospiraceae bacterium]|nr:LytTR family DNA-binding domain-containing protein [Saprospiraceae bacterium]
MESTTQITALIADDESLARDVIRNYLAAFPMIRVIAECENGLNALNEINRLKPDLVFLDIQMPEMDGISMLSELKELPLIIFTTAYNQYAIKAFELNAVDYLLKPFDRDRFNQSIKRVLEHGTGPDSMEQKLGNLQQSLNTLLESEKKYISRILIKGKTGYSFLNLQDVLWIEAYSDYIKIHVRDKFFLKNISLNDTEARLNPQQFIRIHRSSIVNISFIKEMKPYTNGEYMIYLTNGEKLKLSRTYKDKISGIINEAI